MHTSASGSTVRRSRKRSQTCEVAGHPRRDGDDNTYIADDEPPPRTGLLGALTQEAPETITCSKDAKAPALLGRLYVTAMNPLVTQRRTGVEVERV